VQAAAYGGDPAWTGIALISGRWYSAAPGAREVDVNTLFLADTGTKVGGTFPIVDGNRTVTVTIVGEVFPAGILLHHAVIPAMTRAANSGYPPSLISVYSPGEMLLLALAGLVIAVAGALGPAVWAAAARTAFALRTE
jgi:hypothetical protein